MGGDTNIQQPQAPQAPSVSSGIEEYIANYPELMRLQGEYGPIQAQQQVDLAQQFAEPMGRAALEAQEALYPGTTAIQEQLAGRAIEGIGGQIPEWMQDQYVSNLRANLGTNVGSPIGADYTSRGMLAQQEDYSRYYQNLGLSVTGRQPLAQAQTPQTNNVTGSFTPGQVLSANQGIYGTQAGLYGADLGAYQQQQQMNSPAMWMQGAGNVLQGVGSFFPG